jgi:hypothetical protein
MDELVQLRFNGRTVALRRVLSISDEGALVRQLEQKLDEYRRRLTEPDISAHRASSTNYKIWVLSQLLERRSIDFFQVHAQVSPDIEGYTLSMAYLAYAWKVIENYCCFHGDYNQGGTGLPQLPWSVSATSPIPVATAPAMA